MSRVEPQLREYFDAGVERITVDDVIAQAQVQAEPPRTASQTWAVTEEGSTITRAGSEYQQNSVLTVWGPPNGEYLVREHYMVGG